MSETPGMFEKSRDLQELKNDKIELPKFPALPKWIQFAFIFEYDTLKDVVFKLV